MHQSHIPQCTILWQKCAHFCYKMAHCGIFTDALWDVWHWSIWQVICSTDTGKLNMSWPLMCKEVHGQSPLAQSHPVNLTLIYIRENITRSPYNGTEGLCYKCVILASVCPPWREIWSMKLYKMEMHMFLKKLHRRNFCWMWVYGFYFHSKLIGTGG